MVRVWFAEIGVVNIKCRDLKPVKGTELYSEVRGEPLKVLGKGGAWREQHGGDKAECCVSVDLMDQSGGKETSGDLRVVKVTSSVIPQLHDLEKVLSPLWSLFCTSVKVRWLELEDI